MASSDMRALLRCEQERDALKLRLRKAAELLRDAGKVVNAYVYESSGCDHPVGICLCPEIRLAEEIEEFLKAGGGLVYDVDRCKLVEANDLPEKGETT